MSNYIIWNGKNSQDLKGLIISELPHISRPAMRVQITEVEGKNGDFIDDIGYSSYDKSLKIGLYGDYDIDEISSFFSGSGEVIFSNEPDKYYSAKINEQIDFERLVKFRTATVKFHTQPFKYLVGEQAVETEITGETTQILITNQGLEKSKPVITLTGSGKVEVSVNGYAQFEVNIDDGYITVDSLLEECYKDNLNTLKNRSMGGEFPTLNTGENMITWTGNLTKIKIHPMSRWL